MTTLNRPDSIVQPEDLAVLPQNDPTCERASKFSFAVRTWPQSVGSRPCIGSQQLPGQAPSWPKGVQAHVQTHAVGE
jgi:hypothetical protein